MKRARRWEGFIATLWNYAPGEKEQRCCRNKDFIHVRSPLALMAAAILPENSLLGEVGSWTLVVGRVARPPFPLSIHFVPNNFATLVVCSAILLSLELSWFTSTAAKRVAGLPFSKRLF